MAYQTVLGRANQLNCPGKRNQHFENGSTKEPAQTIPPATSGSKTSKGSCERNLVQTTV